MDWHFTAHIILSSILSISVLVFYERTNRLRMYKRLITNCLHGKAAELELANS